jgi:hypothetical protein
VFFFSTVFRFSPKGQPKGPDTYGIKVLGIQSDNGVLALATFAFALGKGKGGDNPTKKHGPLQLKGPLLLLRNSRGPWLFTHCGK